MPHSRRDPGAYAREIAESTRQYLELMKRQNETLHQLVAGLRDDPGAPSGEAGPADELREALDAADREATRLQELVSTLRGELTRHQRSRLALQHQLDMLEDENRTYSQRFAQLEQQVAQLASLFTATFRIHEARSVGDLFAIVEDIVVNMIGCEELAIFEVPGRGDELRLVNSRGVSGPALSGIRLGEGRIGRSASTGQLYLADRHGSGEGAEAELSACLPLRYGEQVLAVVALFRLLPHKGRLEPIDEELMEVVATDGGTALHHARVEQKLVPEAA